MTTITLPAGYGKDLPRSFRPWLAELPEIVDNYLDRWELQATGEFPLSYMYVVPVERADGRPCVLKVQPVGLAEVEGAEREMLGLRLGGRTAVEVVEEDARAGVLLLERAMPGTSLIAMAEGDDDLASETLAGVMASYGRAVEDPVALGLRDITEHAEAFERYDRASRNAAKAASKLPAPLTFITTEPPLTQSRRTAERVLAELLADKPEPWLLHGDLHHDNVLTDDERGLLVIDAWGLYGDRTAEVGRAMHNPIAMLTATDDLDPLFDRRLAIYSGVLGLDADRLAAWCYVLFVISALWSLEDAGELDEDDMIVRCVAAMRRRI